MLFVVALAIGLVTWSSALQQVGNRPTTLTTNSTANTSPVIAVSDRSEADRTTKRVSGPQSEKDAEAEAKAAYIRQHLFLY